MSDKRLLVSFEIAVLDDEEARRITDALKVLASEMHLSEVRITVHDRIR